MVLFWMLFEAGDAVFMDVIFSLDLLVAGY